MSMYILTYTTYNVGFLLFPRAGTDPSARGETFGYIGVPVIVAW